MPSLVACQRFAFPWLSQLHGMNDMEAGLFEYYCHVCIRDLVLFCQDEAWSSIVFARCLVEASIYHAAVATAVLSRSHYCPGAPWPGVPKALSATHYANMQYNQAILALNRRLDAKPESAELAVVGSILFVNIEFLRGFDGLTAAQKLVPVHVEGGSAILERIENCQIKNNLRHAMQQVRMQLYGTVDDEQ